MNKIKKKDVIIFIFTVLLIIATTLILLLSFIPIKSKFNKEMDGIKVERVDEYSYTYDYDTAKNVTVNISGIYKNYLINWWRDDEFCNVIVAYSDYPDINFASSTYNNTVSDWSTIDFDLEGTCHPYKEESMTFDMIVDKKFSRLIVLATDPYNCIISNDKEYGLLHSYMYVFPANTADEAAKFIDEAVKELGAYTTLTIE